jgi:small subunit ribosomal protein S3
MGHKTHPLGFRLGITQEHRSSWYSKLNVYAKVIQEDYEMREIILNFLKDSYIKSTGITKILIHRNKTDDQINLIVHTARPGVLVGKEGIGLDTIDKNLSHRVPTKKTLIKIIEIEKVYQNADLVADTLVGQLEERIPFRRVMKSIIQRVQEEEVKGIKIQIAGRVNGAEIARTEWLREGRVPLQTLRADIDYSYKTAHTTYGILGIKVWLFKDPLLTR